MFCNLNTNLIQLSMSLDFTKSLVSAHQEVEESDDKLIPMRTLLEGYNPDSWNVPQGALMCFYDMNHDPTIYFARVKKTRKGNIVCLKKKHKHISSETLEHFGNLETCDCCDDINWIIAHNNFVKISKMKLGIEIAEREASGLDFREFVELYYQIPLPRYNFPLDQVFFMAIDYLIFQWAKDLPETQELLYRNAVLSRLQRMDSNKQVKKLQSIFRTELLSPDSKVLEDQKVLELLRKLPSEVSPEESFFCGGYSSQELREYFNCEVYENRSTSEYSEMAFITGNVWYTNWSDLKLKVAGQLVDAPIWMKLFKR